MTDTPDGMTHEQAEQMLGLLWENLKANMRTYDVLLLMLPRDKAKAILEMHHQGAFYYRPPETETQSDEQ